METIPPASQKTLVIWCFVKRQLRISSLSIRIAICRECYEHFFLYNAHNINSLSTKIERSTEIFERKEHRCPSLGINPQNSRHIPVPESFKYNTQYYTGQLKEALLLSDPTLRLPAPPQMLQKKPIYLTWAVAFHLGHQAPKKLSPTLDSIKLFSKHAGTNMWMKSRILYYQL